jgi:hypothetical protein
MPKPTCGGHLAFCKSCEKAVRRVNGNGQCDSCFEDVTLAGWTTDYIAALVSDAMASKEAAGANGE